LQFSINLGPVIVERDEDGYYVASVPALAGCHTQARSLDNLMQRIQEAIAASIEDEEAVATPKLEFIGVQRVTVAA
jgi:predicted RNase H-like HicB family nuclease